MTKAEKRDAENSLGELKPFFAVGFCRLFLSVPIFNTTLTNAW